MPHPDWRLGANQDLIEAIEQSESKNMSVNNYIALDLGRDAPSVKALFEGAEAEASSKLLWLTDHLGKAPVNVTPRMAAWYQHISSERSSALDEVGAAYEIADPESGAEGVFLKREVDKIKEELLEKKRRAEQDFRDNNQNVFAQLSDAQKEHSSCKRAYAELRARHNREAKTAPKWYLFALFIIGIADALINFESFASVRGFSPAIALGVTLVVAIALAASSHMHGTFMAQFRSRFGPHADDGDRGAAWRMLGLGTLCLGIVLGLVWYARASYFADILAENATIGGDAPSALRVLGGSLSSNLLVWIVGVIIAFLTHDEDHKFPVALKDRKKAATAVEKLQDRVSRPLQRAYEKASAEAANLIKQAESRQLSLAHTASHKNAKDLEATVEAEDARVLAVLLGYRSRLVELANKHGTKFEKRPELMAGESEVLSANEYASETITLKYL